MDPATNAQAAELAKIRELSEQARALAQKLAAGGETGLEKRLARLESVIKDHALALGRADPVASMQTWYNGVVLDVDVLSLR